MVATRRSWHVRLRVRAVDRSHPLEAEILDRSSRVLDIARLLPRNLPSPLNGFLGLPEVVGALRSLPEIAANTAAMAEATRTLPSIEAKLDEVARGASRLPGIDARMATIEGAMPALVEVQQQLAELPRTMAELTRLIDQTIVALADVHAAVGELQVALGPLGEAADRFSRVARRLPGRRGAADLEQGA